MLTLLTIFALYVTDLIINLTFDILNFLVELL